MSFEIVRNDITNMQVDAIVNTANPKPIIGYGCDSGIHKKAGAELLEARKKIGNIAVGDAAITPAFQLDADYVIHAVSPIWQGGDKQETLLLTKCYETALQLALEHHCESIAFPLLSAGNHGFPKNLALQTAVNAFSRFLMQHEMQIYLVVFSRDALVLSEKLFQSVQSYIDDTYTLDKKLEEYGVTDKALVRDLQLAGIREEMIRYAQMPEKIQLRSAPSALSAETQDVNERCLLEYLETTDATFSETLLNLIDRKGKTDPEVYKKANVDRKLFSKIRNHVDYQPSKATALAFAIALELSLEETKEFISHAGYCMTHSSKTDIIVEYFILHQNYDIFALNEALFAFGQPTIGC